MEFKPKPELRRTAGQGGETSEPPAPPAEPPAAPPPAAPFALNQTSELVADLLAATGLLPPDRLALVRGRAGHGANPQAIADENLAASGGGPRLPARRY